MIIYKILNIKDKTIGYLYDSTIFTYTYNKVMSNWPDVLDKISEDNNWIFVSFENENL